MKINISDIKIRKRVRQENGNIETLMESLRTHGLLNPIVISEKYELIAGYRRLTAAKNLGWTTISATMVEASGKMQRLELEMEENIQRLDFTDDELYEGLTSIERYRNPQGLYAIWRKICAKFEAFFDKKEAAKAEVRKKCALFSVLALIGILLIVVTGYLYTNDYISSALLTLLNIFSFALFIFGGFYFVRLLRGMKKK